MRPCSTRRITPQAVTDLEMDPTRKTVSAVTGDPVVVSAVPYPLDQETAPSRIWATATPGTSNELSHWLFSSLLLRSDSWPSAAWAAAGSPARAADTMVAAPTARAQLRNLSGSVVRRRWCGMSSHLLRWPASNTWIAKGSGCSSRLKEMAFRDRGPPWRFLPETVTPLCATSSRWRHDAGLTISAIIEGE